MGRKGETKNKNLPVLSSFPLFLSFFALLEKEWELQNVTCTEDTQVYMSKEKE
jgi:hypothetical protein